MKIRMTIDVPNSWDHESFVKQCEAVEARYQKWANDMYNRIMSGVKTSLTDEDLHIFEAFALKEKALDPSWWSSVDYFHEESMQLHWFNYTN